MASVSYGTTLISLTQVYLKEMWEEAEKVPEGIMTTLKNFDENYKLKDPKSLINSKHKKYEENYPPSPIIIFMGKI